jgi:hypothetical protein
MKERRAIALRVLLAGLGLGSLGFFVVAGPQAIAPHFERYGMWLIGPMVLLLAMGVQWWMRRPEISGRLRPAVAVLLAWGMLAGFGWYYLRPLRLGLGDSHVAFRTAEMEPKLAALRLIEAGAASQPTEIVARGWWAYWPLAYLAGNQSGVRIVPLDVPGEQILATQNNSDGWQIEFVEPITPSQSPTEVRKCEGEKGAKVIFDAAGRPLLRIVPATTARTGGNLVRTEKN